MYTTMTNIEKLKTSLENLADREHYIFSASDFYLLFPDLSSYALNMLLSRSVKKGLLARASKGFYIYSKANYERGFELFHLAARLREDNFSYLSLESILSEVGIISQIPIGHITLMTGGRSGVINCGKYGRIEFIHTKKSFVALSSQLTYDKRYKLWRASVPLAFADMKAAKRQMDLIDKEALNEFI